MSKEDKPKVVSADVEKYNGLWNSYKATVTTENGKTATGYGSSKENALDVAAWKAQRK